MAAERRAMQRSRLVVRGNRKKRKKNKDKREVIDRRVSRDKKKADKKKIETKIQHLSKH
jgi:hypothetical protein